MDFTEDEIAEFCRLWREEFKEEITPEAARLRAGELVTLFLTLADPASFESNAPTSP